MTDPGFEKSHDHPLKTSDAPSGGSWAASEHPPPGERDPLAAGRGRQRAEGGGGPGGITTHKLWHGPVVPGGNSLPKCPTSAAEPGADAAGEGGRVSAHGNSGNNGPIEENRSPLRGGESDPAGANNSNPGTLDARQGRKKHRRRPSKKKRRWKPYFKLSWEEKKELDERETARASRVREEMFAKGLPVAPYNTTQFLMDEHDREEPDLNTETGARRFILGPGRPEDTASEDDFMDNDEEDDDGSGGGSDGIGRPGNSGGEFLQRDFSETYEKYHVESLQNMTKQELVQEYLELEKCMSRLEEENNRLRCAQLPGTPMDSPRPQSHRELETELERLRAQNRELLSRLGVESQTGTMDEQVKLEKI